MPISRQAPSSLCFLVFRCSIFKVRYHPLSRTALLLYHTHSSLSSLFSFFLEKISNRFCVTRSRGQLCYFSTFIRLCQHIFLIFFSFFLLLSFLIILFCEIVHFIQSTHITKFSSTMNLHSFMRIPSFLICFAKQIVNTCIIKTCKFYKDICGQIVFTCFIL